MYTGNPSTNPIDALRLEFGDTDEYESWLADGDYQYFINLNLSTRQLHQKIGTTILMKLSREVRERSGQEERYGSDAFTNYRLALMDKLKNPNFGNVAPLAFFGGVDRESMYSNATNPDIVQQPFYEGQTNGVADWQTFRLYKSRGGNVEPEDNNFIDGE